SFGRVDSSRWGVTTSKTKPALRRISARRGEAEARMSLNFCRTRANLNEDGFLVFSEGTAQGIRDFAQGGVRFDGREDGGHKIFCGAGAAFDFGEGGVGFCGVAADAQRIQT